MARKPGKGVKEKRKRGQVTITTKVFLRYATLNKGNISWQENHA